MAKYGRIKDLREDSDKTQQELAEYLGTSSQHYGKYEMGRAEIPFERAIMLAEFYGVSLDYIAGRTNSKSGFAGGATAEQRELLELLESMSSEEKDRLKKLAEIIAKI